MTRRLLVAAAAAGAAACALAPTASAAECTGIFFFPASAGSPTAAYDGFRGVRATSCTEVRRIARGWSGGSYASGKKRIDFGTYPRLRVKAQYRRYRGWRVSIPGGAMGPLVFVKGPKRFIWSGQDWPAG